MSLGTIIREVPKKILNLFLSVLKSPLTLFTRLKSRRATQNAAPKEPSRFKSSCSNFFSKTGRILHRTARFVCLILGIGIIGFGIFVGALFYFVNADSVKASFVDIAHKSLGAKAVVSGNIEIQRLPKFAITIPQVSLLREDDNSQMASIDAIYTEVSLWSLPLGAIGLRNTEINGLKTAFYLEDWLGDQAYKTNAAKITFPNDLRVREIAFTNTAVDLFYARGIETPLAKLTNIDARLGELSPELETTAKVSLTFNEGEASPSDIKGSLSIDTALDFSAATKTLTLRDFKSSGSLTESNSEHILLASANRLRLKPSEVTGVNIQLALSAPDRSKGEFTVSLADFLADATRLATPDVKLVFQKTTEGSEAKFDLAAGANIDLSSQTIQLADITGSFTSKGLEGIPDGLTATVKGEASGKLPDALTSLTLAGNIGASSFTYNGSLEWTHSPLLKGKLSVTRLTFDPTLALTNLSWLHSVDFDGEVRIGKLQSKALEAEQFQANVTLSQGTLESKNAIANIGGGRVETLLSLKDTGEWSTDTHFDSVSFESLFATSPIAGKTSGTLKLIGKGNNLSSLTGSGKLRLLRGTLLGIDVSQLSKRAASSDKETPKTTFDELTSDMAIADGILSLKNFVLRNAASRIDADIRINLTDEAISGSANILQTLNAASPKRDKALFSGAWFNPVWTVEQKNLAPGKEGDADNSSFTKKLQIWKNLKDFFKF